MVNDQPPTHHVDYRWTYELPLPDSERGAEDWLRAAWEGGPPLLAWLLPTAWRFGLGLRLGPRGSAGHVLGWPVQRSDRHCIVVAAESPLMHAENSVSAQNQIVRWTTSVTFANRVGRVLWLAAKPVHQWLVPRALDRAVRRRQN